MQLCGDIGGTKVLLALAEDNPDTGAAPIWRLQRRYACADYTAFAPMLGDFLSEAQAAGIFADQIRGGCLAVAGPVDANGQQARLTNLPWTIAAPILSATFGLGPLRLVNDFAAAAAGIDALDPQNIVELQAGEPLEHDVRLVIGAGTGLGVAIQVWQEGLGYITLPGEGGHCGFAPTSEEQAALWAFLHSRSGGGRVEVESLVSGPGLLAIYEFLCRGSAADQPDPRTAENPAAAITALAAAQPQSLAHHALDLFCAMYGAFAGDLALTVLARGGVFIAGGIAAQILPQLRNGPLLTAFNDKAEHGSLTARMPLRVITDPELGLKGAALLARREMKITAQKATQTV